MVLVVEWSTLSYSGKIILQLTSQSVLQQLVQNGKQTNSVKAWFLFKYILGELLPTHPACFPSSMEMRNITDVQKYGALQRWIKRESMMIRWNGVSVIPTVRHTRRPWPGGKTRWSRWLFTITITLLMLCGPGWSGTYGAYFQFLSSVCSSQLPCQS